MTYRWTEYKKIVSLLIQCLLAVKQTNGLRFIEEPKNQIVALGSPLWWDCVTTDVQTVSYRWSQDGSPLQSQGNLVVHSNGTLNIWKISADNVGLYICTVETPSGQILNSREASLQLAYIAPSYTINPQSQTVLLGDSVNLTCSIESLPIANITWYLNGEIVTLGTAVQDENGESTLLLAPIMYYGGGEYKCKATNPLLQLYRYSLGAELVVRGTPVFLASLEDVSVPEGFSATFNCYFHGNPDPALTWFVHMTTEDGQVNTWEILNTDKYHINQNGTMTIYDVTYADQAFYTCSVGNVFGTMSESAFLNVTGKATPPEFTVRPGNTTVTSGDNVTVQCAASGNPDPDISWFKNGAMIQGNGNILQDNGNILQDYGQMRFINIQYTQSGWYSCKADNAVGSVNTSFYIVVQVIPSIEFISDDSTCLLGSQIVLSCMADGNPKPSITWSTPQYGDIYISSFEPGINLYDNGTLVVTSCSNKDGGLYACTARNVVGYSQKTVAVSIESPPEFTRIPVSQSINKGGTVFFHCQSSGVPTPTIAWSKHGEGTIVSSPRTQIYLNNTLVLRNVDQSDVGIYKCTASNSHNSLLSVATLTVTVPPVFIERPENQTVYIRDKVELICQAVGDPVPTQSWRKDGGYLYTDNNLYISSDGSRLTIDSITENQFGEYTCVATNLAGTQSVSAFIKQYDLPVITIKPRNTTVNQSDTVTIPCKGDAKTDPPIVEWFREISGEQEPLPVDRIRVSIDGDLAIQDVVPGDEGWYRCVVTNSAGTVSAKLFLDVHVLPRIVYTNSPQTTVHQSSVILACQSSGDPTPTVQWINPIGDKISPSSSYLIGSDTLEIVSANQNTDDGDWICQSCNFVGCVDAVIRLYVDGLPLIESFTGQKTDNTVRLECKGAGQPSPSFTFRSGNQVVGNDMSGHTVQNNGLIINVNDVKPTYTCTVANKYGSDIMTLSVPRKVEMPSISSIGSTWISLEWIYTRQSTDLPITYYKVQISSNSGRTWQDVTSVDPVLGSTANVSNLSPYKRYYFRVAAGNILGLGQFGEMSLDIMTLPDAPSPPTNLAAIEIDDGTVLFSWSPSQFMNGDRVDVAYQYTVKKDSSSSMLMADTIYYNGTLQVEVNDITAPGMYVFSVQAVNIKIGKSSKPVALTIDLGFPASQTQTQLTGPSKIFIILAGVLGGVLIICIIIFIALRIRRRKKTESLSFLKPRLSLDQFYMENTKQIYRTESRLSMRRSRSCNSFYSFTNDDSFHGKSSVKDSRLQSPNKRKSDCDVLLVAKNPLYTDTLQNYSTPSSRVNSPEPLLIDTEQSYLQNVIELPTTDMISSTVHDMNTDLEHITQDNAEDKPLTPLSARKLEEDINSLYKENVTQDNAVDKPLTPLSAKNLEEDINTLYNLMSAQEKQEVEISLEHVYASIHSDGHSSKSGDLALSHDKIPSQSNQPKPPIRVLSPDKLRYSPPGVAMATKRSSRSASPSISRSKSPVLTKETQQFVSIDHIEELYEPKNSMDSLRCENNNKEDNLTSFPVTTLKPSIKNLVLAECDMNFTNRERNVKEEVGDEEVCESNVNTCDGNVKICDKYVNGLGKQGTGETIQREIVQGTRRSKIEDNFLTDEQIKEEVSSAELY